MQLSKHLAVAAAAVVMIAAVGLYLHERPGGPTWVEQALAANDIHGPVAVVAVGPVRDLVGKRFTIPLESTGVGGVAGEIPTLDADQLNSKIASLHPAALAVGIAEQAVKPRGYVSPPGWRLIGEANGVALWAPPGRPPAGQPAAPPADR
jgi:hypothetical protein